MQDALEAGAVTERKFIAEVTGDVPTFRRKLQRGALNDEPHIPLVGRLPKFLQRHFIAFHHRTVRQLKVSIDRARAFEKSDLRFTKIDVDGRHFMEIDFLFRVVAVEHAAVREANRPVGELAVIFVSFDPEKHQRAEQRQPHANLVLAVLTHFQEGPGKDHRDRRENENEGVDETWQHAELMDRPWVVGANAQKDVAGEQPAKKHDLGGEKEPNANFGIPKAGIRPGRDGVGNLHVRKA